MVAVVPVGAAGGDVMDGNYRLIIEPEKRNRHGLVLLELGLIVPAAVVVALLLVALFGRG